MSGSPITRYLEADVRCCHCGHSAGVVRRRPGGAAVGMVFRRHADGAYTFLRQLTALRCPRCAGSVFAEEFESRFRYQPELDLTEGPRRGRPPTWLVKQRQAQQAEERRIERAGA